MTTPELSATTKYRLLVTAGTTTVSRDIELPVNYRERLRPITMPFARGDHRAVELPDGRILIVGGEDDGNAFPDSLHVFDPKTESFSPFGNLSSGRVNFVAVALGDGNVLVAGGAKALTGAPSSEIINGKTGSVTPTPNFSSRVRSNAAATALSDGRAFISGGLVPSVGTDDTAEVFDPATGAFALLPGRLNHARSYHTATRIDARRVLIYGGIGRTQQAVPPEIYDVVAGTSKALPPPESTVRANHAVITLSDGSVLVVGGEDFDNVPRTSVFRFDPVTETFSRIADLATPRAFTAAGRLIDDRIIVTGGLSGARSQDALSTTELLSQSAQRRDGPLMTQRRHRHTVTRLASGKVLVVGGLNEYSQSLASAEVFD